MILLVHGGSTDVPEDVEAARERIHRATFVSGLAAAAGIARRLDSRRRLVAVQGTRSIRRDGLVANTAHLPVKVDPADATVRLRGRALSSEPVSTVPLNRRYLLG
jgi:urease subunit alpha